MGNDKNEICVTIDTQLLKTLELMEEKASTTVQMETLLRDGHIELAKAKYIRGKESISILQTPVNEEGVRTLFDLETKLSNEPDNPSPCFDISLKRSKENGNELQDPIKWFGVLVPQNLRTTQKRFQEAVYLAVKIANIQSELINTLDTLKSLYAQKGDFLEEAKRNEE